MNPGFRDRDHRRVRNHSAFIISNVKRVKDGRGPIGPGVLGDRGFGADNSRASC